MAENQRVDPAGLIKINNTIKEFWEKKNIYPKAKAKNQGKQPFYFLEGPPYTTGKIHLGTAWNNALKDMVLKYKRMRGFDVWDRRGYDMHGLPTELKVQAKLGLKDKEDVKKFGEEKFARECEQWARDNAKAMSIEFRNLGVWMDEDDPYMPVTNKYMEGEWWMIKRAYEKGLVYKGLRTLPWCADCATATAKHECEYKELTEESIYVKLKSHEDPNTFYLVWTTTPWTIALNLAVMVNPEMEYCYCAVEGTKEIWIIAKELVERVELASEKKLTVKKTVLGKELEGKHYDDPMDGEVDYTEIKKNHPKAFSILLSKEYVDTSAGTGLVHCAPGCGPEDYEVGYRNNLPAFNFLDEYGYYPDNVGLLSKKKAKTDDDYFIKVIDEKNALAAKAEYTHDYPHCWRCKQPVIFRATKQWFFKLEAIKEKMLKANKDVLWVPKRAGKMYDDWTEHLRDNSITKQRFWGTPVPIWVNEQDEEDVIVVGSMKELEELGGKVPASLHKPWIDQVTFKKDGKTYKRLPDVLDVWIDAGTASWNCLRYPQNKEDFEKLFPADFILEATEQTKLWFNMLNICSFLAFDRDCFNNVYVHGMLQGIGGVKMSKSLGNIISPDEISEKYGIDTVRYYTCSIPAGENISFSWDEIALKYRNLSVYVNLTKYFKDLVKISGCKPKQLKDFTLGLEEKYILSRLQTTIQIATTCMDSYMLDKLPSLVESLLLDLSRTYIQLIREQFVQGDTATKEKIITVIGEVLSKGALLFAPVLPFTSEHIYQEIKDIMQCTEESIHMCSWPIVEKSYIDEPLEKEFSIVQEVISAILAARDNAQLGVRWPSAKVLVDSSEESVQAAVKKYGSLIKTQTNVKELVFDTLSCNYEIKPDYRSLGKTFGTDTGDVVVAINEDKSILIDQLKTGKPLKIKNFELEQEHLVITKILPEEYALGEFSKGSIYLYKVLDEQLEKEGYARELVRRIQSLRKKAGLTKDQKITLTIETEYVLGNMLNQYLEKIGAQNIDIGRIKGSFKNLSSEKIKGKSFKIGFDVL